MVCDFCGREWRDSSLGMGVSYVRLNVTEYESHAALAHEAGFHTIKGSSLMREC